MIYIYSAQIEFKNSDGENAAPSAAPTITAVQGISKGSAAVDLLVADTVLYADRTGVYRLEYTGTVKYDYVSMTLANTDPDFELSGNVIADLIIDIADDMPASVWAYTTRTLTSFGALIADIWGYVTRTLTQSATSVIAAVSGSSITQIRGNTWDIEVPGLTLDPHLIQFAIKRQKRDADKHALLMIDTATGLLYVNGEVASKPAKASLSYVDTILTITVKADITAQLPVGSWPYGIQSIATDGTVAEIYGGVFVVTADIVRGVDG